MRIRKNARLGGSLPAEKLQAVVCQLNQSPWDVIPFGSHLIEFEYDGEDDSFEGNGNGNGSAGNNFGGAVESVASPADAELKSPPNINDLAVDDDNDDISERNETIAQLDHGEEENKTTSFGKCKNNEGKKQRLAIDEHDSLSSVRSKKAAALAGARRTRAQNAKKAAPPSGSSNPYEFYYYSGFGPLWRKRRGGRNNGGLDKNKNGVDKVNEGEDSTITEANANGAATVIGNRPRSSWHIDSGGFDYEYVEEEIEEDYDEEEESGKKRMRKPVKARSLKSLM